MTNMGRMGLTCWSRGMDPDQEGFGDLVAEKISVVVDLVVQEKDMRV